MSEENKARKGKIFSLELLDIDDRNLDVVMRYLTSKKGIRCKRGQAIRTLIAIKYAEIVSEADSLGKSLEDYLNNK